jgi:aryl-alcohol dehydrogenase-like predicted oxidoreductase
VLQQLNTVRGAKPLGKHFLPQRRPPPTFLRPGFDTLPTSVSIADQEALELTLPLARQRQIGVNAKRPVANAAWRYAQAPENTYVLPYRERLKKLDFLRGDPKTAADTALRFTLSVPGVHTAIVGTTKPGRWRENAELLAAGPLPAETFERIRARWRQVADASWVGQV